MQLLPGNRLNAGQGQREGTQIIIKTEQFFKRLSRFLFITMSTGNHINCVTTLAYNTVGDAVTLPEEATERYFWTPPPQPKESAIHSYRSGSKLKKKKQPPPPHLPNAHSKTHDWLAYVDQLGKIIEHSPALIKPKKTNKKNKKKKEINRQT